MIIALIGIDGSGKTTLGSLLEQRLPDFVRRSHADITVKYSKLVSDDNHSVKYFKLMLDTDPSFDSKCQNYIFAFERYRTAKETLEPLSEKYDIVVLDRYAHCDIAFCRGRGIEHKMFYQLLERIPKPDLGFVIDVPVETAMSRIKQRGNEIWTHQENVKLLSRARIEYLRLADEFGFRVVDGCAPIATVLENIMQHIHSALLENPSCDIVKSTPLFDKVSP